MILDTLFCKIKWTVIVLTADMNKKSKWKVEAMNIRAILCIIIKDIPGKEIV